MTARPRPLGGKWVFRTATVTRWVASQRAAERLMGDHLTNTGRTWTAVAGVIYDPTGTPFVGGLLDGLGWVAVDPLMIEELMSVGESHGG